MPEIEYIDDRMETEELLESLSAPVRNWFEDTFPDFTDPQKIAIPRIMGGDHLLLCSPTGSGKTLTAFLSIIDDLVRKSLDGTLSDTVQCIYISPIKALANDIQKNLIGPLTEIKERFLPSRAKDIKVGLRTGDTPQKERERMLRRPPHILITTPESLGLALASKRFRPILEDLRWMIIDEMHSLVPTKRGTHLSLSLALMDVVVPSQVQRIGISATMEPLDAVAEFLVASDPRESDMNPQRVSIAKISGAREIDMDILLPTARFSSTPVKEILDHNIDRIKELVEAHTTTLVFVNTRNMTETVVQRLKVAGLEGVEGHHGSGQDHPTRRREPSEEWPVAGRSILIQPRDGYRHRFGGPRRASRLTRLDIHRPTEDWACGPPSGRRTSCPFPTHLTSRPTRVGSGAERHLAGLHGQTEIP